MVHRIPEAHEGDISSLRFLENSSRLVTTSSDGAISIWDAEGSDALTGLSAKAEILRSGLGLARPTRRVATTLAIGDGDHLVFTDDGYYSASRTSMRSVALEVSGEPYDFESWDPWMNRPDIVLDRLGHAAPQYLEMLETAYQKRVAILGVDLPTLQEATRAPPTADITLMDDRITADPVGRIRIVAAAGDAPLRELIASVNSVPMRLGDEARINPSQGALEVEVPLLAGANRIQVSVRDEDGIESPRRTVVIDRLGAPEIPDLYLLTVGVSQYSAEGLDLNWAAKDAGDIQSLFSDSPAYGSVHRMSITDTDATREAILDASDFLRGARLQDHVVVFFAGHGMLDSELGYWFGTLDIDPANPGDRGLAYSDLIKLLDATEARQRLLLLDTCHAGEVDPDMPAPQLVRAETGTSASVRQVRSTAVVPSRSGSAANSFLLMRESFADLHQRSGTVVLAASGGAEYSLESSRWQNGAFTFSVREAIGDPAADFDGDGQITVSELYGYVLPRVAELTQGGQQPTARQENLDLDFVVY